MRSLVPAGLTRCVRAVLVAAPGTLLVLAGGLLVWLAGLVSGPAQASPAQAVVAAPVATVAHASTVSTMTPAAHVGTGWLAQGGVEGPSDDVGVQPLGPPGTGSPSKSSGASNSAISSEPVAAKRSVSVTPDPDWENAAGSVKNAAQPLRNVAGANSSGARATDQEPLTTPRPRGQETAGSTPTDDVAEPDAVAGAAERTAAAVTQTAAAATSEAQDQVARATTEVARELAAAIGHPPAAVRTALRESGAPNLGQDPHVVRPPLERAAGGGAEPSGVDSDLTARLAELGLSPPGHGARSASRGGGEPSGGGSSGGGLASGAPPGQDVDQLLAGGADLVSGIVSTVAGKQAGARTHQLLSGMADEVTQALRVGNALNGGGRGWSSTSGLTAAGVKELLGGRADSVQQRLGARVDAAGGKAGAADAALLPARTEAGLDCASGAWCDRESAVRSILAGAVGARGPPAANTTRTSTTGNERTTESPDDTPYILTAYDAGAELATQQANDQALNDRLAVVTGQRNLDAAKGQLAKGGITQAEYDKQVAAQKALQTNADTSMAQLDPQDAQLIDYVITGQQQLGKDQTALTQQRKDLDAAWDKQRADLAAGKLDVAGLIGTAIDTGRYRHDLAEYNQRRDDVYAATDELRAATGHDDLSLGEPGSGGAGASCGSSGAFTECAAVTDSWASGSDQTSCKGLTGVSDCTASAGSDAASGSASGQCSIDGVCKTAATYGADTASSSCKPGAYCQTTSHASWAGAETDCSASDGCAGDTTSAPDASASAQAVPATATATCQGDCSLQANSNAGGVAEVSCQATAGACDTHSTGTRTTPAPQSPDQATADPSAGVASARHTEASSKCQSNSGSCDAFSSTDPGHTGNPEAAGQAAANVYCGGQAGCTGSGSTKTSTDAASGTGAKRHGEAESSCTVTAGSCHTGDDAQADNPLLTIAAPTTAASWWDQITGRAPSQPTSTTVDGDARGEGTAQAEVDCAGVTGCSGTSQTRTAASVTAAPTEPGEPGATRESSGQDSCTVTAADGCTSQSHSRADDQLASPASPNGGLEAVGSEFDTLRALGWLPASGAWRATAGEVSPFDGGDDAPHSPAGGGVLLGTGSGTGAGAGGSGGSGGSGSGNGSAGANASRDGADIELAGCGALADCAGRSPKPTAPATAQPRGPPAADTLQTTPAPARQVSASSQAGSQLTCTSSARCDGQSISQTSGSASGDVPRKDSTSESTCNSRGGTGCSTNSQTEVANRATTTPVDKITATPATPPDSQRSPQAGSAPLGEGQPVSVSHATADGGCPTGTTDCAAQTRSATTSLDLAVSDRRAGSDSTANCASSGAGCVTPSHSDASSAPDYVVYDAVTRKPLAEQPTRGATSNSGSDAHLTCTQDCSSPQTQTGQTQLDKAQPASPTSQTDKAGQARLVSQTRPAGQVSNWFNNGANNHGNGNNGNNNTGFFNTGDANLGNHNQGNSNIGNANVGNANRGNANVGNSNVGNANRGSYNVGDSNVGSANLGNANVGNGNRGNSNVGNANVGSFNRGSENVGNSNVGDRNGGNSNRGSFNQGNSNVGNSNVGSYNRGNSNVGNANVGSYNRGNSNIGNSNVGDSNVGDRNRGNANHGNDNVGNRNQGNANHGNDNIGNSNRGDRNHGDDNQGNDNVGNRNVGNRNAGDDNRGDDNAGNNNQGNNNIGNNNHGNDNAGNDNRGNENIGNNNRGDRNTGDDNQGNDNLGDRNHGDRNTGDDNQGNDNTGDRNHGNSNTGNDNRGDRNTGNNNKGNDNTGNDLNGNNQKSPGEILTDPRFLAGVTVNGLKNFKRAEGTFNDAAKRHTERANAARASGDWATVAKEERLASRYRGFSKELTFLTSQHPKGTPLLERLRYPLANMPDRVQKGLARSVFDPINRPNGAFGGDNRKELARRGLTKVGGVTTLAFSAYDMYQSIKAGDSVPHAALKTGSSVAISAAAGGLTQAAVAAGLSALAVPGAGWAVGAGILAGAGASYLLTKYDVPNKIADAGVAAGKWVGNRAGDAGRGIANGAKAVGKFFGF